MMLVVLSDVCLAVKVTNIILYINNMLKTPNSGLDHYLLVFANHKHPASCAVLATAFVNFQEDSERTWCELTLLSHVNLEAYSLLILHLAI